MKTYCKYYVSLHGGKFNFRLHSYHIFLRHYCVQTFLLSSSMSYSLSGRQTDIVCTRWIFKFILPWFSVIPMQISAHIWNFFRINCIILCFQNSSGASLYSLPEPFRFHRGWVSVKAQQQHEVVSFYLSLNRSLKLLLLSAGKQVKKRWWEQ